MKISKISIYLLLAILVNSEALLLNKVKDFRRQTHQGLHMDKRRDRTKSRQFSETQARAKAITIQELNHNVVADVDESNETDAEIDSVSIKQKENFLNPIVGCEEEYGEPELRRRDQSGHSGQSYSWYQWRGHPFNSWVECSGYFWNILHGWPRTNEAVYSFGR